MGGVHVALGAVFFDNKTFIAFLQAFMRAVVTLGTYFAGDGYLTLG